MNFTDEDLKTRVKHKKGEKPSKKQGEKTKIQVLKDIKITLDKKTLDAPDLLKEGTIVMVQINTETDLPLSVDMPSSIVLEVTYAEPGVKGNTATNATKHAKVETGASVNVPLFINEGDKIKIDTATGSYMERVKE